MNIKCKDCQAYKLCKDSFYSWIFLIVGIIATVSIRLVNLVMHLGNFWPKLFWYIGVAGFFIYFLYRFREDRLLRQKIKDIGIISRVNSAQALNKEDYKFVALVFCRLHSNKDSINYFFIFFTSGLVLLIALYQDFFKG